MGVVMWENWTQGGPNSRVEHGGRGVLQGGYWRGKIKMHLSHHEIVFSKQIWWIAYFETSDIRELLSHQKLSGL